MNKFDQLLQNALNYYHMPLMDLLFEAHTTHRANSNPAQIQKCTLLSIKTGGCPEDCRYCSQSAHNKANVEHQALLSVEEVRTAAREAKKSGAHRLCMGAAWRKMKNGHDLDTVVEIIRAVKEEGLEACVTLGMLTAEQAERLKEAGLDFYNHNIDTSRNYYPRVATTRTFADRLQTIDIVRQAGIKVCCGGIIGMGETREDRCAMLAELASFEPPLESVPINLLVPIPGTPFADLEPIDHLELIRTLAVARILMPKCRLKLSAGRAELSRETQILAFFAGSNAIFLCDKLLTTPNASLALDQELLKAIEPLAK